MNYILLFLITTIFSFILANYARKKLLILAPDIPNARSNHQHIIPRGGGLAIIISIIVALEIADIINLPINQQNWLILISALPLSIISFFDDLFEVKTIYRFILQLLSAIIGVKLFVQEQLIFQGLLGAFADQLVVTLILVWFINLFNFMDGMDGLAASVAIHLSLAIIFVILITNSLPSELITLLLIIIFSVVGFLLLNWPPAKIFMGDVGSITLGYLLGILLLIVAAKGYWLQSTIMSGYYLADGGITILIRLFNKEAIWQAHSKHFYQKAIRNGQSHQQVLIKIIILNFLLLILSLISLKLPLVSSILALILIITLLIKLAKN